MSPEGDGVTPRHGPQRAEPAFARYGRVADGPAGERVTDELRVADDKGAVDEDVPDARRVRVLAE